MSVTVLVEYMRVFVRFCGDCGGVGGLVARIGDLSWRPEPSQAHKTSIPSHALMFSFRSLCFVF